MDTLRKLFDFRELTVPEPLFQLSFSRSAVDEMLEELRERFLTIEEVAGPVEKGDIVVLDLPADGENEAGRVQLNVGKHFYDTAFEDSLIGLEPGAAVTAPARDGGRAGTLAQIKRRVCPPLDDALVARLNGENSALMAQMGLLGAETVDGCRALCEKYLLAQDKRKKTEAILSLVQREVLARSEFGDLSAQTEQCYNDRVAQVRAIAAQKGKTYEEVLAMAAPPQYGTDEARDAYLHAQAEGDAKLRAVCLYYLAQSGKELDQETFRQYKQDCVERGLPPEQVEECITYDGYLASVAQQTFKDTVLAYYENQYTVAEKP